MPPGNAPEDEKVAVVFIAVFAVAPWADLSRCPDSASGQTLIEGRRRCPSGSTGTKL